MCYRRAAAIAGQVLQRDDFPDAAYLGTKKQQAQWLRQAGSIDESLAVILEMLKRSPNVIELQLQAALSMEEIAVANDSAVALRDAIAGTSTDGSESSVWGWGKLTTNLHRLRFSNNGNATHAQLLRHSQFHLARCRWLLASVANDPADRQTLMNKIKKQLATVHAASSAEDDHDDGWKHAFSKLAI